MANSRPIEGAHILAADDDPDVLEVLAEMLEMEGHLVFKACDGQEAVNTVHLEEIHAVVMDIDMPRMNGIDALRNIKQIDPTIEVLIITGNADLESLRLAIMDNGAFDYIIKPFSKTELIHTLNNALTKRIYFLGSQSAKLELKKRIEQLEAEFEQRTRQFRESQIKYKEIIENSSDGIFIYQDGGIRFTNLNMVGLTGYSKSQLYEIAFENLLFPEDRLLVTKTFQQILDQKPVLCMCRFQIKHRNGNAVWVEAGNRRTLWEERAAVLTFLRDITERKQAEASLKKARDELDDRVQERTAALLQTNIMLQQEITERKHIENEMRALLKKQEINIQLAKDILNLINGVPPRYIDLSCDMSLFVHAISLPCLKEGGDHFFLRTLKKNGNVKTIISLKDQSGHSVNCILRSIATDLTHQSILHVYETCTLEKALSMLNDLICESNLFNTENFVTAITAEIDHDTLMLRYVSNGHPPFFVIRGTHIYCLPENEAHSNIPIAWVGNQTFTESVFQLEAGDKLIFYTDGLNEMPHIRNDQFLSFQQFQILTENIIRETPMISVSNLMHRLIQHISEISQVKVDIDGTNESGDDITIIGMELEKHSAWHEESFRPENMEETANIIIHLFEVISSEWKKKGFEFPIPRLQIVLEESVRNAWIHGNKKNSAKNIWIRWRYGNDFHLQITDEGQGFDVADIPNPQCRENLYRTFGRGLLFIRHFSSYLSWRNSGRMIHISLPQKMEAPARQIIKSSMTIPEFWERVHCKQPFRN